MNMQEIYEELNQNMPNLHIKKNENMKDHTSFKVGGTADIFINIEDIEQLKFVIKYANEKKIPLTIIGNGSNLLVKDNGIRGITIQLNFKQIEIEQQNQKVFITVGSGVKIGMLAVMLQKKGIAGFEFASRNTRNYRWSNSYECRSIWQRNERNCKKYNIYR